MNYKLVKLSGGIRGRRGAVLWLDVDKPLHTLYAFDPKEPFATVSLEVYTIDAYTTGAYVDYDGTANWTAEYAGTRPFARDLTPEETARVKEQHTAYLDDSRTIRKRKRKPQANRRWPWLNKDS